MKKQLAIMAFVVAPLMILISSGRAADAGRPEPVPVAMDGDPTENVRSSEGGESRPVPEPWYTPGDPQDHRRMAGECAAMRSEAGSKRQRERVAQIAEAMRRASQTEGSSSNWTSGLQQTDWDWAMQPPSEAEPVPVPPSVGFDDLGAAGGGVAVPEPGTLLLVGVGLLAGLLRRRR